MNQATADSSEILLEMSLLYRQLSAPWNNICPVLEFFFRMQFVFLANKWEKQTHSAYTYTEWSI